MRTLTHFETKNVSGSALNFDQKTYATTLTAQAVANLAFQVGLRAFGTTPQGFVVTYVLLPALNIAAYAITSDFCNRYLAA